MSWSACVPNISSGDLMLNRDFKELLELFNAREINYLIVGGYALAVHGVPRYTGDLDLWVWLADSNARKILAALQDFGLGSLGLTIEDFTTSNRVIQIGYPPVRVDIMTSIDAVTFDEAWKSRIIVAMDGLDVPIISRQHLIANKQSTGRFQDLADLEKLL
jgi:hypothetical protein